MQPTLPQSTGAADMDLPSVQSVEWLFKKERMYLLAQFWQQRATLAEKEVSTLKEQLSSGSPNKAITQNGAITSECPQSSSPALSESGATNLSSKLNVKSELELTGELKMEPSGQAANSNRTSPGPCDKADSHKSTTPSVTQTTLPASTDSNHSTTSGSGRTLADDLAAKDKEIAALVEEVARLRSAIAALQESHAAQIQRLEDRLEQKRQQINRLEARLDKQSDYEDVKKENSLLRSVDLSTSDSKQFQELLQERTKALAAHSETHKSASADGSVSGVATPFSHNSLQPGVKFPSSSSSSSSPGTPAHTPTSTPISLPASHPTPPIAGKLSANGAPPNSLLPPPFANVETFGSFLGEEIVSNWRRGLELPPPPPHHALAALRPSMLAPMNHHHSQQTSRSPSTDVPHHQLSHDDKPMRDHDTCSTASSTPVLPCSEENLNGGHPHTKSPAEDNNNTLTPLTHTHPMLQGLPFQFQERGHFRFAEDLQLPPGSMVGRLGDSLIPKGDPMEAKLQEMLRYNMDKYANQNLDTLHISRRVRELLSVHNIGQRLFAKYVLGLSQGTVSELLSKPKPWDKLTEKGRDSYRKMHAWGCDDNAVLLLKSLIPKKAPQAPHADAHPSDLPPHPPFPIEFRRKDSAMPPYGRPEDSMTDERIAHILSEASNLMKTPQVGQQPPQMNQVITHHEDTHSNEDSKSPHNQCTSPFSKDSSQNRRLKKYENDDIPQEKVARIYHEELTKLMKVGPRDGFSSGGMPPMNQIQDESLRMTFEAYQRELVKLQQSGANLPNFPNIPNLPSLLALQQHALNGAQDLSLPKEKQMKMNGQQVAEVTGDKDSDDVRHSGSAFSLVRPKQESASTPTTTASSAPSPLGNSILPPAITPTEDFSAAASPLQRMASITNSLITQPPVTPHHSTPQRPLKAVLPPITQQQFDMFNNLNTEDIVRRVKEALSQYSISQRLFGESVLGLSQGSVSDLLARPKPWHMLTQKGREPFIRMKMFLEDDNAVHKLVASQYKIAPEKLMRTGSYSGSPQIPPSMVGGKMPPMPKLLNDQITKMQQDQQHLMQQMQASPMQQSTPQQPPNSTPHQGMLLTPPGLPPHHAIPLAAAQAAAAAAAAAQEKKQMPMPVHSPQQNNSMRGMHQHMSPTVYEMAALTQDLDTQVITTKIKEALLANNIGQKIFGEAVLGLSQGSVSELLSKPKPWHMLSIKGREPFIRMQLWLSDANNVDRLQALKNERREANKRRRSTGPGAQDNSSDTSSNDTSEFYHSNSPGPGSVGSSVGAPPSKKQRVLFSEEQKEALRLAFALDPYPNVATIEFLATELGLSTRTITNWFHNHRMRLKQQVPHGAPSEPPVPPRESQSGAPFDPVHFRILLNQRLMELQKERMGLSGVPLQYTPYFATNPNLAALISRGLLPGAGDADLSALNNAFKEQMSGLDLSLKREGDDDFDDVDGEADSHVSDAESIDEAKSETKETPVTIQASSARSSRRKPAAPQWVNPDWQDDKKPPASGGATRDEEVIINGVCVMQQAADYSRTSGEETVRIEPQDVAERFEEREEDEAEGEAREEEEEEETRASPVISEKAPSDHLAVASPDSTEDDADTAPADANLKSEAASPIKKEVDDDGERWEY